MRPIVSQVAVLQRLTSGGIFPMGVRGIPHWVRFPTQRLSVREIPHGVGRIPQCAIPRATGGTESGRTRRRRTGTTRTHGAPAGVNQPESTSVSPPAGSTSRPPARKILGSRDEKRTILCFQRKTLHCKHVSEGRAVHGTGALACSPVTFQHNLATVHLRHTKTRCMVQTSQGNGPARRMESET